MRTATIRRALATGVAPLLLASCDLGIDPLSFGTSDGVPTIVVHCNSPAILVGQSTVITCTASGFHGPPSFAWEAPAGCALTGTGATVTATPSRSGFFRIGVRVSNGPRANATGSVTIGAGQRSAPTFVWDRHVSELSSVKAQALVLRSDGGYAAVGDASYSVEGSTIRTGVIVAVDADAQTQWVVELGNGTGLAGAIQAADGGLVVAGKWSPNPATDDSNIHLAKYTAAGSYSWQRHFDEPGPADSARGILTVDDSTYCLLGTTWSGNWLIWTDAAGDELRSTRLGADMEASAFARTPAGEFIVAGWRSVIGVQSMRVAGVSAEGAPTWSQSIDGFQPAPFLSVLPLTDGGAAIAAGFELVRLDASGHFLWRRSCFFESNDWQESNWGVGFACGLADGEGFLLTGFHYQRYSNGETLVIARIDPEGQLDWFHEIGGQLDRTHGIVRLGDGSIVIAHHGALARIAAD